MELILGYKQSDVGMVPDDWNVMPLGKLVRSVEYGSAAKSDVNGAVPVLRMGNLQGGKIDWSDLVYTDDNVEINKYMLQPGDVLFNRTNTIDLVGKTSIYEGGCPAIFAGYLIRINVVPELLDSRFLNYILNTEFARKYSAKVLSVAVGQANINGQKLKTYPIPLPPKKAEQDAIATALSDVDALLVALDQMIAKKRDLKQATMQQLLTGETRLPGFSGEWEVTRLGSVLKFQVGYPFSSAFFNEKEQGVRLIKNRDLKSEDQVFHYSGEYDSAFQVSNGDVLVGMDGDFLPCRWAKGPALLNQRVGRVVPLDGLDREFAFYYLIGPLKEIELATSSTTVKHLSHGDVEGIEKLLPLKDEQVAIAAVLSDIDAELSALETRRDKTRNIKQAMMQELLTGKTRLV